MENASPFWSKLKAYCDKAERCHFDVKNKLFTWQVPFSMQGDLIARLIEENLLNEERYAFAYVHDHHEFKKWGRERIKMGLKRKRISDPLIVLALKSVTFSDERELLIQVAKRKWKSIQETHPIKKRNKLTRYLFNRGFDAQEIQKVLTNITGAEDDEW
jgi:regulatory protein